MVIIMNVSKELQQRVEQQIQICIDRAQEIFKYRLPTPTVSYEIKGNVAGKAGLRSNRLMFNAVLLNENIEHFIAQTVTHEVAHLIAFNVYCDKGHGSWWKHVMRALGVTADRCHRYDVTNSRTRTITKYEYFCGCKTYQVGGKIHNKIQQGATYTCRLCKGALHTKKQHKEVSVASAPIVPVITNTKKSNKQIVKELIESNSSLSKQELVELIMKTLDVKKDNAGTYIYNYYKGN
jgi:SprT protein